MAEASTLQRASNLDLKEELASLFEGKVTSHDTEFMDRWHLTPHVPLDDFGSQSVNPASRRNVLLSYQRTDETLYPVSMTPSSVGPVRILWHRVPNAPGLIGRRPAGESDYCLVWDYSYDPNLQGGVPGALTPLTGEVSSMPGNVLVDVEAAIVRESSALVDLLAEWQKVAIQSRGRERLADRLRASFEVDYVEDGKGHTAEEIISEALRSAEDERVLDWLRAYCTDATQPSFAASTLRCLGRHDYVGTTSWRVGLLRDTMAMDSVEVKDAAVQAAESWGDSEFVEVLRSHIEPEPWLRQYILDVVGDLAG